MERCSAVRWFALVTGALALAATGCESSGTGSQATTPQTDSEFKEAPMPSKGQDGGAAISTLATVYFDFDRAEIRSDARGALRSNASAINTNGGWGTITIEGHCDERGSEEYNLALGERRANAVKRYLADLGVSSSRMRTVSFGEARPAVAGHDESAWKYNRRSEFKTGS